MTLALFSKLRQGDLTLCETREAIEHVTPMFWGGYHDVASMAFIP